MCSFQHYARKSIIHFWRVILITKYLLYKNRYEKNGYSDADIYVLELNEQKINKIMTKNKNK